MENRYRVVIISPCRDEEATLERTIGCMCKQTYPPDRWIVVDDGSRDHTPEILKKAAVNIPWLRIIKRPDRGYRKVGGGVIDAFNDGLQAVDLDYDFIAKMDVDLEFSPRYIECLLKYFQNDPKLAAASGKVYRRENMKLVEEYMIDEMVAGQFKFYRREAFERIGGFVREVMWDGIDFHQARLEGYHTASFHDPELRIIHLRLMGSSDRNIYRGRIRWGRGQWFMGSCFPYVFASGLFRMREKPYFIGGFLIVCGYLIAALHRERRYNDLRFRQELRRWQYTRLRKIFFGNILHRDADN
ncbi:glycosyltransferase [Nitrosococcus wardiae]|uniref:Glycosyltransferase family 2 protein n=1 Tax=Nitrosococcus wardiae TaxID=1814290 RepID=A0A4V1AVU9_9GAMM|nr:glycosyltransferase family 2 protein [Nitrosococcus wardiae]QBQ54395.1 glycosyltransferase family 2 protein [Nitrosococcus wardiae]